MTLASPESTQTSRVGTAELGGKYRILADLGEGGTATVSLAVARGPSGFSKLVVLKVMKSSLLQEAEFSQMFMNEARLAARLNHPNIVQTNEVFEHHGLPVIVMEYLEGQPLSSVLARARGTQRFPLNMQLRVISDVLGGLHYSHDLADFDGTPLNVVHRDVSPHNVFITFDGQVKLLDFGIAKLSGSQVETAAGVIKGKIRYMSPEQIIGQNVDRRADVFAVGVILWEAVTGARMWAGMNEPTIINQLLNAEIPKPSSVAPVDAELERIVMKSLELDPAKRYASAADLQADIDEYLARHSNPVRQRELGKAVSELFEDVRTQTRRIIEGQLSRVASLSDTEYAATQPLELTSLALTQTGSSQTLDDRLLQQKPKRRAVLLVAFGAALGVGALIAFRATTPSGAEVATARAPVAPPPPIQEATEVAFRLTAFPASAKIFLDGQLQPSNPVTTVVARDGKPHVLRFEAAGFVTEEREVTAERDADIVVSLIAAPKPVASEQPAKPKPASVVRKVRPAPPPRKPGACDPPFVVDARGVKRYKPECL